MTEPTETGKERYDDHGYYVATDKTPCTCVPECPNPCKGECGCEACHEAYGDFLGSL